MRNIKSAQRILDVHTAHSNQSNNKVDFYLSTIIVFYHNFIKVESKEDRQDQSSQSIMLNILLLYLSTIVDW